MATKAPATATPVAEQTSLRAINANIGKIRSAGAKLNDAIHTTAIMILQHSHAYNDCTGAARLVDAMPKTHRRALLIRWFEMFSPIVVEKKADAMTAHLAKDGSPKFKKYNIEGAKATRFDALPEVNNEPGLFTLEDLNDAIERLVKRAERLLKDSKVAEEDIASVKTRVTGLKMVASLNGAPVAEASANDTATPEAKPEAKAA